MTLLIIASVLAGLIAGFAAGASPAPSGTAVCSSVGAFIVGGMTGLASTKTSGDTTTLGILAVLFLVALITSYIGGNVLLKHDMLKWMGISK